MYDWLFFLLPVAALSGWVMARKYYRQKYLKQESPFSPEYFRGLNYLLNEQPDKAIDVFIGLLEVNSDTVETHLALANLFRRRGEADRAIRIHQNLIARPTLSAQQRKQALVELGLDYMHAGVLDRAEQLFLELLQQSAPPDEAARQLLRIYQQEKNWQKAINMAKLIPAAKNKHIPALIAQFYCELAEQAMNTDRHEALNLLKQAHYYDDSCVRASLLEARLYLASAQYRKALKPLQMVEKQNYQYIPEALPLLRVCYSQMGNLDNFISWLQQTLEQHPNMTSATIMLAQVIQQQQGTQAAQHFLFRHLHKHPSVEGLSSLMAMGDETSADLIPLIKEITDALVNKADRYTCKNCGFSGKTMHWLCPGCAQWGTIRPTEVHLSALEKLLETR